MKKQQNFLIRWRASMKPEIRDALDGFGVFFGVTLLFATLIQWAQSILS
jgi:hypothetical protein